MITTAITTIFVTSAIAVLLSVSVFASSTNTMATQAAAVHSDNQPSSGDKPVKNNDKATKGDNRSNDHPACGGDACPVNNKDQPQSKKHTTTTASSSSDGIQGEPNVLCRGKIIHHSCEPCPAGFKDTGTKCVPVNQKQKQKHQPGGPCEARINCPPPECKKGEFINPMTHKCVPKGTCVDSCPPKPIHHSKAYNQGYQMGCTDGPDQENFIGTGGLAHHSKTFVQGYNDAFTHGPC